MVFIDDDVGVDAFAPVAAFVAAPVPAPVAASVDTRTIYAFGIVQVRHRDSPSRNMPARMHRRATKVHEHFTGTSAHELQRGIGARWSRIDERAIYTFSNRL